jgi:hypothetical protein
MIKELLERAVTFFRVGQFAYATLSFRAFMLHSERRADDGADVAIEAYKVGDYLRCADVLEYEIAPLYSPLP